MRQSLWGLFLLFVGGVSGSGLNSRPTVFRKILSRCDNYDILFPISYVSFYYLQ